MGLTLRQCDTGLGTSTLHPAKMYTLSGDEWFHINSPHRLDTGPETQPPNSGCFELCLEDSISFCASEEGMFVRKLQVWF